MWKFFLSMTKKPEDIKHVQKYIKLKKILNVKKVKRQTAL